MIYTIVYASIGDGRQISLNVWEGVRIGSQNRQYEWHIVGKSSPSDWDMWIKLLIITGLTHKDRNLTIPLENLIGQECYS